MQMLKKLFSSDKKYYLELDEIKDSEVVQTAVKTAEKAAEVVKEKASEVASSQPVKEAVKTASEVTSVAQEKLASAITQENSTEAKPETKAKSATKTKPETKAKQNGKAEQSTKEVTEAKPALKNSGASSFDPPFWVAAMNNTNSNGTGSNGKVTEETFATNNLMPAITNYRRRPGGSLDKFKDMAKKAKTPKG